jgi:hypothetical protein
MHGDVEGVAFTDVLPLNVSLNQRNPVLSHVGFELFAYLSIRHHEIRRAKPHYSSLRVNKCVINRVAADVSESSRQVDTVR